MLYTTTHPSPLGPLTLTCGETHLIALHIGGRQSFIPRTPETVIPTADHPVLRLTVSWLERYFAGQRPRPEELPLAPEGSSFQRQVWRLLADIPYGVSRTYGELARCFSDRMSAQAIGQAVGRNPIAIILPCHRVLGAGGRLTGFSAGLEVKRWLLNHEGIGYCP